MGGSVNLRGFVLCISIVVGSMTASSRDVLADDEATEQARMHYQEAQKQFDLGLWDAAVAEFTKAYELRPDPNFLYNMAQAYRRGGNARRAIDLYKNYLIKVPKSPQRAEVEERIQTLQRQLDGEEREAKRTAPLAPLVTPEPAKDVSVPLAPPPAPSTADEVPASADTKAAASAPADPTPTVPEVPEVAGSATPPAKAAPLPAATAVKPLPAQGSGSRALRIAGIVTGAAGLAGIAGGVIFSIRTKSLSDSVSNAATFSSADARAGKQAATLQWVCYGTGVAAVVAGALLYWQGRARTSVSLVLTPTHAGLLATGAF
jgi:hypothetical protein